MPRLKLEFRNQQGVTLAGLLETPNQSSTPISHYALFAHCFTCGKDIAAASRISRALAERGIAVLRFDFTGLGNSDGDFANTNFSSNIDDLVAAADTLAAQYQAPSLLIGHSLGGAAVLSAAHRIASVKAIATIAAPSSADHVQHLFADAMDTLSSEGEATVKIGMRQFAVKKQLLDDLNQHASTAHIADLRRPLLIYHSPVDTIVPVAEAAAIYKAARHPKSYLSLDHADHLLSKAADAEYVALTLSAWASRYLQDDLSATPPNMPAPAADPNLAKGEVSVTELDKKFLRKLQTPQHALMADEPESYGGSNLGPTPYDLLLMGLGACTSMTIRMYANRKKIALDDVEVRLVHEQVHADDCAECEGRSGKLERITRHIKLVGDLSAEEKQSLLSIADRCPVHRTLESDPVIAKHLWED